jgi:hypothetical protein
MYLVQLSRHAKRYWQQQKTIVDCLDDDYKNDAEWGFLEHDPVLSAFYRRALASVKEADEAIEAYFAALVKKEGEWLGVLSDVRNEFRGKMNPDPES